MTTTLTSEEPLAIAVTAAIQRGDLASLERLLRETPGLATARIVTACGGASGGRSLLHLATDWPGHFPGVAATIAALVAAGADVNARFVGRHAESPLHWAASSDDVAAIDALCDAGADLEATGGVVDNGTPLADAVHFAQWTAARRLVARGARVTLAQAAALAARDG